MSDADPHSKGDQWSSAAGAPREACFVVEKGPGVDDRMPGEWTFTASLVPCPSVLGRYIILRMRQGVAAFYPSSKTLAALLRLPPDIPWTLNLTRVGDDNTAL